MRIYNLKTTLRQAYDIKYVFAHDIQGQNAHSFEI